MKNSYEVLKSAIDRAGVKKVAAELHISSSLVYKWCQKLDDGDSVEISSGAANPLDRIRRIYEETRDPELISWICQMADGYFVANPSDETSRVEGSAVKGIQRFIKEFSETLDAISTSYADRHITVNEGELIRKEWEDLKGIGERFVRACEAGRFNQP